MNTGTEPASRFTLEIKVGIFVFLGLLAIAVMAVQFGRLGQGINREYPLTIVFKDAGGLIKNAQVRLSGAVIGHLAETPSVDLRHIGSVHVQALIQENIKLPKGCNFAIGSSGMLGDKSLLITPPDGFDPTKFDPENPEMVIPAGALIQGDAEPRGLDAITTKGSVSMDKLNENLELLREMLKQVNTKLPRVLSDENIANLRGAFSGFKTAADNIAQSSQKIGGVIDEAKSAVESAKGTLATANTAVEKIQVAAGEAQEILHTAKSGHGTLPMLLNNRETAENLRALLSNVRRHGILFYRDSAAKQEPEPSAMPAPVKKPRGRAR